MGYISIDVDIEDYIDEVDDDVLISEVLTRLTKSKGFKEMFNKREVLAELTREEAVEALIEELRLSIVQAELLSNFIKELKS